MSALHRAVEDILLLHLHPWHPASLPAQLIAPPGQFLLLGQKRPARVQPFFCDTTLLLSIVFSPGCYLWLYTFLLFDRNPQLDIAVAGLRIEALAVALDQARRALAMMNLAAVLH
jgi:hypothetical protein